MAELIPFRELFFEFLGEFSAGDATAIDKVGASYLRKSFFFFQDNSDLMDHYIPLFFGGLRPQCPVVHVNMSTKRSEFA